MIGILSVTDACFCDSNGIVPGDHLLGHFSIDLHKPRHIRKEVAFRKYRFICVPDFIVDIVSPAPLNNVDQPLSDLVKHTITVLNHLLTNTPFVYYDGDT